MVKKNLKIIALSLLFTFTISAQEYKFKPLKQYKLSDFNLSWDITYMEIVGFGTKRSDGKKFEIRKDVHFWYDLKVGKLNMSKAEHRRNLLWLAHALMKPEYFWKKAIPLLWEYDFTMLCFLEKGDARYKAISNKQDILDMFGKIDTQAELLVWLNATHGSLYFLQGYSKTKAGYKVHFEGDTNFCEHLNYYEYYDFRGKLLSETKIDRTPIKDCNEALP